MLKFLKFLFKKKERIEWKNVDAVKVALTCPGCIDESHCKWWRNGECCRTIERDCNC